MDELKVGDRVRIISIPGANVPNYCIHIETIKTYSKLISRGTSVRIFKIDEHGQPWYKFKFRKKNGQWEKHLMCIMSHDNNWVKVKKRNGQ